MNWWQTFLLQILIISLLLFFYHDPSQDYQHQIASNQCLQTNNFKTLCAQCYIRKNNYPQQKGYLINTIRDFSILKIKNPLNYISCKQFLHFVEYEDDNKQINIQLFPSIYQIIRQMKAQMIIKHSEEQKFVIQPDFKSFVIYRWFLPNEIKENQIKKINFNKIETIYQYLKYFANAIFIICIGHIFYNEKLTRQINNSVKVCFLLFIIIIELICFNTLFKRLCSIILPINVSIICLLYINVPYFIIFLLSIFGYFSHYYKYGALAYSFITIILFIYFSNHRIDIKYIVKFTFTNLLLLFITSYIQIYTKSYILADGQYKIIQLSIYFSIILSMIYLSDPKKTNKSDILKNIDPETRSISLNVFQENEQL